MHLIASETPIPRPGSTDWVKVFFPNYLEESYRRKQLENHFVLMFSARIGMKEIRSNPSQYVMLFRPSMLGSDFGGILPERTRCLYSRWDGNLDRPDWQAVTQALEKVDGDLITLTVEATLSKHRRKDTLPLHPNLVVMLQEWLVGMEPDDDLFPLRAGRRTW